MKTSHFFTFTLFINLIIQTPSIADTELSMSMTELEKSEIVLGDDIYNITKSYNENGNLIVFQSDSLSKLSITDDSYNVLAKIHAENNYTIECELQKPVVYFIVDREEYQQPVIASCGDSIYIREAE